MNEHAYVGGELELFAQARHWKAYWISCLRPFLRGAVLEVGAGLGVNTMLLRNGGQERWLCLEPDPQLFRQLEQKITQTPGDRSPEAHRGTLASLSPAETFDTILYIDVLEHIADDRGEVERAGDHLTPGGRLVVLSPAHRWLFSRFDQAIGHYRRYTAKDLEALTPPGLRVVKVFYLDSVGLLASAANRFLLRQPLPNARQIRVWDSLMVPCSRILDPLTACRFGKSVVGIWERKS